MQKRAQSAIVQVCLALACALGAGFSGDLQARHAGQSGHHARHARGGQHRTARSSNRDSNGDHTHEIELDTVASVATTASAGPSLGAVLPVPISIQIQWVQLDSILAPSTGSAATVDLPATSSRGPPVLS
jgi:hypothetical protein